MVTTAAWRIASDVVCTARRGLIKAKRASESSVRARVDVFPRGAGTKDGKRNGGGRSVGAGQLCHRHGETCDALERCQCLVFCRGKGR